VVALLSCFLAVDAAGVFVLVWARFGAVSAFRAVGANIIAYATILGHVSVPLAFVVPADRYVVPDFACVPEYENFAPGQFFSYLGWCFYYPARLFLVFATCPKAELDICDVVFGESLGGFASSCSSVSPSRRYPSGRHT
jgi:hypothetical protein